MKTFKELFEEKFTKGPENECWEWQASRKPDGYGKVSVNGVITGAHRVSYALYKGDIGNLQVCHSCDNPPCVNPNHLFLGTIKDNMLDMMRKGRALKKLSLVQRMIAEDAIRAGYNCSEIARYFRVTPRAIRNLKIRLPENLPKPYWSRKSAIDRAKKLLNKQPQSESDGDKNL